MAGCMSDNLVNTVPQTPGEQNLQWIGSSSSVAKVESEVTVSKAINGNSGGIISITENLGGIEVKGTLTVPPGAYSGMQNISISFNENQYYQVYTPTPYTFKAPLILDLTYKNVDLNGVDISQVGFYYLGDNGVFYKAKYNSLVYDPDNQTLGIKGAEIPHFSRWGWAK